MRIPITIQMQPGENGAAALCMMLGYFRRFVPLSEMREHCVTNRNGSGPQQIIRAAEEYGLRARQEKLEVSGFREAGFPLMVLWKRRYYAIVRGVSGGVVRIADPAKGEYRMTLEKFLEIYSGTAILFEKGPSFVRGGRRESLLSLVKDRLKMVARPAVFLLILSVLIILVNLLIPDINKDYLDEIVGAQKVPEPVKTVMEGIMYALMILLLLLTILRTRLLNKVSRNMSAASGSRLFKKMFSQPLRFFEQYSSGELMARIDGNTRLDYSIIQAFVPRVIDAFMMVFYLLILFTFNPALTGICLAVYLIFTGITLAIQEKSAINARSAATSTGALDASLLNGMSMIDTIVSSGAERSYYNIWHENLQQTMESRITGYRLTAVSSLVSSMSNYLLQGVQMFVGAAFIVRGQLTLGALSLFQSYLNNLRTSTNNVLGSINTLQTMRTNIERIRDITERETRQPIPLSPEETETADKLTGDLRAEHITFRYNPGDRPAVDDVSLEVAQGQMVALVGASGCGKSTLLKILADLYSADGGSILYGGRRREEIPDVIFHSSVMTVDQETVMFEDSIYNNIKLWDDTIENYEVILAARDAKIHERIMRGGREYGTMVLENGSNFSGGELQRLELARALAHEPTLLLLDEFTSALDALTEDQVIRSLREKGTTCIIVAHRLSTIVGCDRIYVMDKGKIVQQGTHEELYSREGLYRSLIKMQ